MEGGGDKPRLPYFTVDNLHHILTNRAYVGERRYKVKDEEKIVKACWKGIIDETIFRKVQTMMKKNRYRFKSFSEKRHNYLLTGRV